MHRILARIPEGHLPDTEEHRAIGDRANALMQEMKRQIAEKLRKEPRP